MWRLWFHVCKSSRALFVMVLVFYGISGFVFTSRQCIRPVQMLLLR